MRDRKCKNNEEQKPINTLRRSPRFLHRNQAGVENPGTPLPAPRKIRSPGFFSTPIGSSFAKNQKEGDGISQKGKRKGSGLKSLRKPIGGSKRSARLDSRANLSSPDLRKQCVMEKGVKRSLVCGIKSVDSQLDKCGGISKNGGRNVTGLESSAKPSKGSKRSGRLDGRANVSKAEEILHSQKEYVIERRVTRSSVHGNKFVCNRANESGLEKDSEEGVRVLPKEGKARVGVSSCKQSPENIEKRVTRSSSRTKIIQQVEEVDNVSPESRHINKDCGRKMHICEKRKRYQAEEECEIVQGWNKEQELALQRAYFTAKPTPHFWKKVAKMVPGKSAEECFDRIHSDLLTPLQLRTRSRAKKNPSPLSFSASKLLSPAEMKTKRLRSGRRKTLLAQKTVRELLQKQQNENQEYEADLFAVLEPTMHSSSLNFQEATLFTSPAPNKGSGVLTRCRGTSSSAHKKHRSRLNDSQKAAFASPPVLKQIKNKALHEKYIDQLHCRDAKRKAESLRNAKCIQNENDKKSTDLKVNSVKVAKDALVLDAQDAINKLRSLQASTNDNLDDDDNVSCSNEDEDELC